MFTDKFPGSDARKVRAGATIKCEVDGITYVATVYRDEPQCHPEKRDDGFWPSLDPKASGWIGENPARSFDDQMAACNAVVERYKAGKMIYCGVGVVASKGGVELTAEFQHALWGIDINWPQGDNGYLREVANELLSEARDTAKANLTKKIELTRARLTALEASA